MIAVSPTGTHAAAAPAKEPTMRHTRCRLSSDAASRYSIPMAFAFVVHVAVLFWPNHGAGPQGVRFGDVHSGNSSREASLFVIPSAAAPSASEASESGQREPRSLASHTEEAPKLALTPLSMPRPDFGELVELPFRDTTLDSGSIAAALRDAAFPLGLGYGSSATQAHSGARNRQSSARRGEADGKPDLYEITQLDCEPALLRVPDFQFPKHLSRQGIHAGRVTVLVRVDANGRVSLLAVTASSHPDLVPAVSEAVVKALFQPPLRQGQRVTLRYSWTLELKDRTQVSEQSSS